MRRISFLHSDYPEYTKGSGFLPVDSFGVWMPALMEDLLILVNRLARHLNAQLLHEPSVDRRKHH